MEQPSHNSAKKTNKLLAKVQTHYLKDYLTIIVGTLIYAVGVTQFIIPHKFVTGGLTGICVLLNYAFHWPLSITLFIINLVLLGVAWRILGNQFLIKTIVGVVFITLFIGLFEALNLTPIMQNEMIVAGLIGAIMCGVGIGLVFSVNGSTGGTDIIVMIINKYRNFTPGRLMMVVDLIIVCLSYVLFKSIEVIVFGILIIAVMTTAVDYVINGVRQSVQFFIFSKNYEAIATGINQKLHRGCTIVDGMGWFSKKPQKVIVVIAKRNESVSIFRLVKEIDAAAFVSQTSVSGVYGLGFDKIRA